MEVLFGAGGGLVDIFQHVFPVALVGMVAELAIFAQVPQSCQARASARVFLLWQAASFFISPPTSKVMSVMVIV